MSHTTAPAPRRSVPDLRAMKGQRKIVALTAYTAPMAKLLDPHCDLLLVGDSLGMVIYGFNSTLPVTLEMMVDHGAAVVRGSNSACIVVDMPFGSYQASPEQAFLNCARVLKETGAAAVKLEGGAEMADTVRYLTARGIPVMGHVGLMPQHMNVYGGFKTQGRENASRAAIVNDAQAITEAGTFALLLEGIVEPLAAEITRSIAIPTIGIGASPECDGQILVVDDMLGMFEHSPRFVKKFAAMRSTITDAAAAYAREVRAAQFPDDAHCYASAPTKTRLKKPKR